MLRSPKCPRSVSPFNYCRRAVAELSAFLEADAPQGGHDPALLREEHAQRFAADIRHRVRNGLPGRGVSRPGLEPSAISDFSSCTILNYARATAYRALESGAADAIGLDRAFITALPAGGRAPRRSRSPFSDEVARALADEGNLRRLAEVYDPNDRGIRDIWEAIIVTGRRGSEVTELRLDCIGRHHGLAMLWHDQTKVGNYNEAVRIPEALYRRLDARRATSLARFEDRHGRSPTTTERAAMALFPTHIRNPKMDKSLSRAHFNCQFRDWVDSLAMGRQVPHQARHTMATNLLRAGATLAHIRRFLGHVSDQMAEHYIKVSHSDLEDALNAVWVAGPGSDSPGKLLSGGLAPMSREKALALSIDLSRRSTAADGGFCTHQPVVNGGACPWNLDCENCDKFVMSGADLLYWRRKQEQWRAIAERAPDDATADYLHQVFEPTARAIDGLEKALAGLGLLEQALALDLRRPQDYFHRIWSTAFRASDLAADAPVPAGRARRASVTGRDGEPQTAAAIRARRASVTAMVQRVDRTLQQMRRERAAISIAAVGRRAGVSRTFLYQNAEARALVTAASGEHAKNADARASAAARAGTAPWRERALNAESELKRAHGEITSQRARIAELLGRIRDLEHDLPEDGIARIINENHALRAQVRQLTQDSRRLEERLAGARDNNRFLDKRIADLEAEILSHRSRQEAP